jgi:UDP-N-acetylglucosamine 2-epimerase (non-hydrolysing)
MKVFSRSPIPIVYPMHPRTKKRLQENKMLAQTEKLENQMILPPLGYLDFLILMKNCRLIITDLAEFRRKQLLQALEKRCW